MPEVDFTVTYKEVPGFPGYAAGSDGSIWSCRESKRLGYGGGSVAGTGKTWRMLTPKTFRRNGYLFLCLFPANKTAYVHRLVLAAFSGCCPPGLQCRHLDGNPKNNRPDNLAWGTPKENQSDMARHGTRRIGERHPSAKLSEDDVAAIRSDYASGATQTSLATKYSVARQCIGDIVTGRTWRHVDSPKAMSSPE